MLLAPEDAPHYIRIVVPGDTDDFDFLVIGSGFGGAVVAQQLAEKKRWRVLVLERGQPHPPGSFTRTPRGMSTNFWDPGKELYGMFEAWSFDHLDAVVSSGLGGGSLIYANVMLRKDPSTFVREDRSTGGYEHWPIQYSDLVRHYKKVERLFESPERFPLEAAPYDATLKTQAMMELGSAVGQPQLPKLAIRFAADGGPAEPGRPIPGGEQNVFGVSRSTCRLCGECDLGCNYGAKSTLDLTCLSQAHLAGAEIRTCCEVHTIEPASAGRGYVVGYEQHIPARHGHQESLLDPVANRRWRSVRAEHVVLAAGAIGTPRLLLENRASLHRLSPALGARVSANGDYLAWIRNCREEDGEWRYLEPSSGPVITTAIHVDEQRSASGRGFYIEDAGAPAFADWLWQGLELPGDVVRSSGLLVRDLIGGLRNRRDARRSALLSRLFGDAHVSAAMMPVLAMGRDIPSGRMSIGAGGVRLDWSEQPSEQYYAGVRGSLERLARAFGGELFTPLDRRQRAITVHPVGGCAMADSPREGVVDSYGRVYGHPGLWVADGSVMPGPVGANPSLTIGAVAHRFAGKMVEEAS